MAAQTGDELLASRSGIVGKITVQDILTLAASGIIVESAEKVIQTVRFGEAVSKGDPLVITDYHGSTGPTIVERANATNATKMPAYGVAMENYAINTTGLMIAIGDFDDFDTSSYSVGDTLYVAVGGGMTNVKPTGTALIQNMGIVSRSNANNGQVEIVAIGRVNDIPNLPTGHTFIGTATNPTTIDLTTELNNKLESGDNVSELVNDAGYITSAPVTSVNGDIGIVVLDTDDIAEGITNEYYTEAKVSANADVVLNTAKVGITPTQSSNITANNAKISFDSTSSTRLANTSGTNTGDQDLSGIATNASDITDIETAQGVQDSAIALNTAKVGITTQQASDITTNNSKVGITTTQANDILANNSKIGITSTQSNDITTNNAKVGITSTQASNIVTNNAKVGITPTQASNIVTNNAKVGITPTQASNITTNNAKVSDVNHVTIELPNVDNTSDLNKPVSTAQQTEIDTKQDTLVSATNIKTVNGSTLLGSGNLVVSGSIAFTNNTNNNVLTATGTQTLSGENNFTFDGNTVIGGSSATITTSVIDQGVSGIYDDLNSWDTNYVSGEIMKAQPNGEDVTVGECLVLTDGFSWMKADASDVNASTGMLGIALQTSTQNNGVDILIAGFAETTKVENTSATPGTPMYLRENTAGEMSDTLPSGGVVRLVGYCYNNDQEQGNAKFILRFDPDNTWVEI